MKLKNILYFLVFMIILAGCTSTKVKTDSAATTYLGTWQIDSFQIDGIFQQIAISEITFEEVHGKSYNIYGNSGVNSFFGEVKIDGSTLSVADNMGSTKMAGSPEAMEYEDNFLACLTSAEKIEITEEGNALILTISNTKTNSVLQFIKR